MKSELDKALGHLFSETKDEQRRTELLALITPRVVGNRADARAITEEFRQKLDGIAPPPLPSGPSS